MSAAALAAIVALIETIIQETPQALAIWASIKTVLNQGTDPTAEQWATLVTALATSHAKVQSA